MAGTRFQGFSSVLFGGPERITVSNFKALSAVEVDLSSLTVIVGANSSGKSSLLQSILMLCQSAVEVSPGYVNLNSEILQLGTSNEVITKYDSDKSAGPIEIGFTFPSTVIERARDLGSALKPKVHISLTLAPERVSSGKQSSNSTRLVLQKMKMVTNAGDKKNAISRTLTQVSGTTVGDSPIYELNQGKGRLDSQDHFALLEPGSFSPTQIFVGRPWSSIFNEWYAEFLQRRARFAGLRANAKHLVRPRNIDSFSFDSFEKLESYLFQQLATRAKVFKLRGKNHSVIPANDFERASRIADRVFESNPQLISALNESDVDLEASPMFIVPEDRSESWREASSSLRDVNLAFNSFLGSQVSYLGPLREREQSAGLAVSQNFPSISPLGPKGEKTAQFLNVNANTRYKMPVPGESIKPVPLLVGLNAWLKDHFHLEELNVKPEGLSGPVARLGENRFQHVGTGISQIIPVLVLCLSAQPGSTILLEQPELHLHPKLQQLLADFLVQMTAAGRQIILETQSEYMVTRIRRHVVEDSLEPGEVSIVFSQSGGKFISREVRNDGSLNDDWPEEFFDFTLDDTLVIMNAAARSD
jgi:ABC-type dipeptide/oligopeptide/nickel transport system ATPase component